MTFETCKWKNHECSELFICIDSINLLEALTMLMGVGNEFQWRPTSENKFVTKFQWSLGWMLRSVITCNGFFLIAMGFILTRWSELIIWNGNTWLRSSSAKLMPISCLTNRTLKWVSASYCTTNSKPISLEPVLAFHAVFRISARKTCCPCLAHLPTLPTQDPNCLGMIARNRTCFGVYDGQR